MPLILTDDVLDYLLESAGLTLTDAEKADLKTIHDGLAAMKARVRQPRGRMAEPAHSYRLHGGGPDMSIPTIAEAAALIAAKKLSPVELTQGLSGIGCTRPKRPSTRSFCPPRSARWPMPRRPRRRS